VAAPKPKPKGGLGRKVGPLPAWAWGAILLGAVGAWWLFSRTGSGGPDAGPVELVSGNTLGAQDEPYGGYPSTATPPAQGLDPDVLDAILALGDRVAGLTDSTYTREQGDSSLGYAIDGLASKVDQVIVNTTLGAPASSAVTASTPVVKAPTTGVVWGGRTFTTKAGLSTWLKARGASYTTWAANHPDAAKRLR
jgi:hypothetical protein